MYTIITLDAKEYVDFNEIKSLDEKEQYIISISLKNNAGAAVVLTGKTVTSKLRFVSMSDSSKNFEISSSSITLSTGMFTFNIGSAFVGKSNSIYKVFFYLDNDTDSVEYNIYSGKLIITKD